MARKIKIAPSLLSADFARLDREIKAAEDAGADLLHVDVMDGHFVPNLTIGPLVVEAISRCATVPLDVHLMITDPEKYVLKFIEAGSNAINFHAETVSEPEKLIELIRSRGLKAGIALNPETPVEAVARYVNRIDQFLVMTVHPGFGGQALIPDCIEKIRQLAKIAPESVEIEVDGGVNEQTVSVVAEAGANILIAGTAVFGKPDRREAVSVLRENATKNT